MKRATFVLCAFFLILSVVACDFAGVTIDLGGGGEAATTQPQSLPVEAGIDSPSNGTVLQMAPVEIAYHATSTEGVSNVELSIDGGVVSSIASPDASQKVVALKYTWNPTTTGSHNISVRAQNKAGAWSDFSIVNLTVEGGQQQQPPPQQQAQQTNTPEATNTPQPSATPDKVTIFDIKHDKDKFYYGDGTCGSREITISARVTQPEKVYSLVLFTRFTDKEGGGTTNWDSGHAMSKKSDDLYSVTLTSNKITNYNAFEFAVMGYQFVATDKQKNNIARTESIYDITIEVCS